LGGILAARPLSGSRIFCRSAAIAAWFLHLLLISAVPHSLTLSITLFPRVLLLFRQNGSSGLDSRAKGRRRGPHDKSFCNDVLQLPPVRHLLFVSGADELLGRGWWNGERSGALKLALRAICSDEVGSERAAIFLYRLLWGQHCCWRPDYPIFIMRPWLHAPRINPSRS